MAEADSAPSTEGAAQKLDDLMLAMDVVDTIRHQDSLVERELGQDDRDAKLKARLRQIYESQGLEVTDRVLNQGIAALKESRFVYTRRGRSFARWMALAWVKRGPLAIALAVVLVITGGIVGWSSWQHGVKERAIADARIELAQSLPAALRSAGQAVLDETKSIGAISEAERLIADGEAALARGDAEAARDVISGLESLRSNLLREYDIRIVSRQGESTGVFRIPDVNQDARNYYLVVEAITPSGSVLELPIVSEEDGTTASAATWAIRVPKATYDAVAVDKRADGIVDDNRLGTKPRGSLAETYLMDVEEGRIREW